MKTIYILLTTFLIISQVHAQHGYDFEIYEMNYHDLEEATVLTDSLEGWSGEAFPIDFGFPFMFNHQTFTSLEMVFGKIYFEEETNIVGAFAGGSIEGQNINSTEFYNQPISFNIEGDIGNRILKVEIKDANSFYDECLVNGMPDASHVANFQYWLFEGTNIIELHYGPNNFLQSYFEENEASGPVAFFDFSTNDDSYILLTGDSASPTLLTEDSTIVDNVGLWPSPAAGTLYRFTPVPIVAVHDKNVEQVKVYPSPVSDFLHIAGEIDATQYTISDLLGTKMMARKMTNKINVAHLDAGVYSISFYKNTRLVGVQKFVKM